MKFNCLTFLFYFLSIAVLANLQANRDQDYHKYHMQIVEAEKLMGDEKFKEALNIYDQVFLDYDFIFLRDYKIAAQVAFYINEKKKAFQYIKEGITAGWNLKELKKNKFLEPLQDDAEWKTIEQEYDSLYNQYLVRIDQNIREEVQLMFKKDQRKAIGALFRIGNKSQERYGTKKFAPHSENQMFELIDILNNDDYPGEKIIGNDFWMSTIIGHHNSISYEYVMKDTLYNFIKPKLIRAIENGEMSPYEFALIDDWQKAVSSDRRESGYGYLNSPNQSTLSKTNELRKVIGLRSVELRNKLVDVEKKTGMNFYLPNWIKGKINVE